jgi:hypothetical protein
VEIRISSSTRLGDSEIHNIKEAVEPLLTSANNGKEQTVSGVLMGDGFRKTVTFGAVNKGTYWQVTVHSIT